VAGFYLSVLQAEPAVTVDVSVGINDSLVAAGFAFITAPVAEKFLPQMLALDQHGAVDFDKGCYLGQEIVARAEFRGAVKRKLVQFSWQDTPQQVAPEIGTIWQTTGMVINVSSDGQGLVLAKSKPV
jgi:folate-binding protein YgfZ